MASRRDAPRPEPGARRYARAVSALFMLIVLGGLAGGAGYLHLTGRLGTLTQGAALEYQNWLEQVVNDPDNAAYRAEVLRRAVDAYRTTPVGKSLPLRDDAGHVVGRFRIQVADVTPQPQPDPKARPRYDVRISGGGELWHETGGRVRFEGRAELTYEVDFKVDQWKAYCWFTCTDLRKPEFECTHIDNILGQMLPGVVRNAGRAALEESLRPGFTLVLNPGGDTWVAQGKVGREFKPRSGPFAESDRDCETLWNDVSRLERGFRDYLGPLELHTGEELRVTVEALSLDAAENFGPDVLLLSEADFAAYEDCYPRRMAQVPAFKPIEGGFNVQRQNFEVKGRTGRFYLVIDYTEYGLSHEHWKRQKHPGLVKYYVRLKK